MTTPLLRVTNLVKTFPVHGREPFLAVDDVSFSLERGGSLAIVGESGSGKTTTARMIARLETPDSGTIALDGGEVDGRVGLRARRMFARRVQMVFQDPFGSLDPRQSLGEALGEILAVHFPGERPRRKHRIAELLDQVGLESAHGAARPRQLSGGQRQRFAIARALALQPELLILDESVSALDVSVQAQVLNLLIDLRERLGLSYLFVSHDLAVVRQVCDDVVVMNAGRVVESGPTDDVMDRPQQQYTQELLAAIPRPGWKPSRRRARD